MLGCLAHSGVGNSPILAMLAILAASLSAGAAASENSPPPPWLIPELSSVDLSIRASDGRHGAMASVLKSGRCHVRIPVRDGEADVPEGVSRALGPDTLLFVAVHEAAHCAFFAGWGAFDHPALSPSQNEAVNLTVAGRCAPEASKASGERQGSFSLLYSENLADTAATTAVLRRGLPGARERLSALAEYRRQGEDETRMASSAKGGVFAVDVHHSSAAIETILDRSEDIVEASPQTAFDAAIQAASIGAVKTSGMSPRGHSPLDESFDPKRAAMRQSRGPTPSGCPSVAKTMEERAADLSEALAILSERASVARSGYIRDRVGARKEKIWTKGGGR